MIAKPPHSPSSYKGYDNEIQKNEKENKNMQKEEVQQAFFENIKKINNSLTGKELKNLLNTILDSKQSIDHVEEKIEQIIGTKLDKKKSKELQELIQSIQQTARESIHELRRICEEDTSGLNKSEFLICSEDKEYFTHQVYKKLGINLAYLEQTNLGENLKDDFLGITVGVTDSLETLTRLCIQLVIDFLKLPHDIFMEFRK